MRIQFQPCAPCITDPWGLPHKHTQNQPPSRSQRRTGRRADRLRPSLLQTGRPGPGAPDSSATPHQHPPTGLRAASLHAELPCPAPRPSGKLTRRSVWQAPSAALVRSDTFPFWRKDSAAPAPAPAPQRYSHGYVWLEVPGDPPGRLTPRRACESPHGAGSHCRTAKAPGMSLAVCSSGAGGLPKYLTGARGKEELR